LCDPHIHTIFPRRVVGVPSRRLGVFSTSRTQPGTNLSWDRRSKFLDVGLKIRDPPQKLAPFQGPVASLCVGFSACYKSVRQGFTFSYEARGPLQDHGLERQAEVSCVRESKACSRITRACLKKQTYY
jgi:hypothetical protein